MEANTPPTRAPPIHLSAWRRVLVEPDHPASAVLDEQAFDEATARAAVEAVVRLYEKLQPHIRAV